MTKTERYKLDRQFSAKVRARGECERCGNAQHLQTHHLFSRTYLKMRYDERNVLCLCAGCHFFAHRDSILFADWLRKYLGADRYQELLDLRNKI